MGVLSAVAVAEIKARGSIKDADVLKLRRSYYDDGRISIDEAEMLFALNDACPVQDPAWADCFIESITDYLVEQAEPHGYLTAENAAWLIERIAKDGHVESKTELELLVNVLDKARWAPQSLVRFALEQVKDAVLTGTGPLRSGKKLDAGIVTEADVDLLRRILYSFGSDGNVSVSQPEAEVLLEIDQATADADNHPAWTDLFVKAIGNCVMTASSYAPPPREVALARDAWLDRRGDLTLDNVLSRHGLRLHRPVRRLPRAVRGRACGRPPGAAKDRDRHPRSHHDRGGRLARRAYRPHRQFHPQRAGAARLPQGGEPVDRSEPAEAGRQGCVRGLKRIGRAPAGADFCTRHEHIDALR